MFLVSVPTDKDFHIWCAQMKVQPCEKAGLAGDALWVPTLPETLRVQTLEGHSGYAESDLIGQFSNEERAALLATPAPVKATKPVVTAPPADAQ